jgi:hypothetical protein
MKLQLEAGTKVVGFSFEGKEYSNLIWNPNMEDCIGKVGVIDGYNSRNNTYYVVFDGGNSWHYPADMIRDYIFKDPAQALTVGLLHVAQQLIEIKIGGKVLDIELEDGSGTRFIYKSERRPNYWIFIDLKTS